MSEYFSLGDAINRFLEQHGLKDELLIQGILTDWEKYVGKPIAANTEKVWFEKETLYIKVSSPAWKNELLMARHRLQKMINQKTGKELVKEIRIV